MQPFLKLVTLA